MSETTRQIKIIKTEYEQCLDDAEQHIDKSSHAASKGLHWAELIEIRHALKAIIQAMRSDYHNEKRNQ